MDVSNDPQYRTTDGSALRVWKDTAQNNFLSEREGRAIFDEVTYVEVISPGSRDSTPVFEVRRIFAEEMNHPLPHYGLKWAEYKEFIGDFDKNDEADATMAGTPLSQWSEMTRTMAASLKAQNIFTVDALAALPDTKLTVVGPDGRTWREKAKAFIEASKGSAYATALAAENERLKLDLATQGEQLAALAAQVAALQAQSNATPPQAGKAAVQTEAPPVAKPPKGAADKPADII